MYQRDQTVQHDTLTEPRLRSRSHLSTTESEAEPLLTLVLLERSLPLLEYAQKGAGIQVFSEEEVPNRVDHRVVIALEEWLRTDDSKLL